MDTYKLKHQSRGGKNRKANLGVVNLWWRELQANLHLQANHQGPLLHISGSSMALSPNWIISQSTQPRTRSEEATEEDPQRGEGKRNTVAWGLLVPRQQQERVSHEMGLSALQKKKKWASLVVRQPGLVIHPTSWTLCVFYFFIFWAWTLLWLWTTGVITNRVVVFLWDRWIGREGGGEWRRGWCSFFMKQKRMMLWRVTSKKIPKSVWGICRDLLESTNRDASCSSSPPAPLQLIVVVTKNTATREQQMVAQACCLDPMLTSCTLLPGCKKIKPHMHQARNVTDRRDQQAMNTIMHAEDQRNRRSEEILTWLDLSRQNHA